MHRRRSNHLRAFTLVELLVVIGIIAMLIGILLPILAGINERGRDLKCQANLRSIIQAIHGYATENKGSMPWGFVYEESEPIDWEFAGDNYDFICWASLISNYVDRTRPIAIPRPDFSPGSSDRKALFSPILQCPEADQGRPHVVSYAMNMLVGVSPRDECRVNHLDNSRALRHTTKQSQLLKETAVVWDTAILHGKEWEPDLRLGFDIDHQRIWIGSDIPQWRYYTIRDFFAHVPPGIYAQNKPIDMRISSYIWYNRDPAPSPDPWPYQGNLRFRHRKNMTCNVAFSDGSVRQFTGKFKRDGSLQNGYPNPSHDALRRYFMIKWPPGKHPNRTYPH